MATSAVPLPTIPQGATGSPISNAIPGTAVANPNLIPGATTAQTNPYAAPSATVAPAAGATTSTIPSTGVSTSTVQNSGINFADGSNTVTGDLKDTYGAGTGTAISQVLAGLGNSTDAAVQATIANTDLAAGKQYANIQANEAASGVTANSSTAALASGDFYTGVNAQLQQTVSGMELSEENTLLSTLLGTGAAHGPDTSTWDSIMNGISDAATIGGDVLGAATGIGEAGGVGSLLKGLG